jgi:hypothetical protein
MVAGMARCRSSSPRHRQRGDKGKRTTASRFIRTRLSDIVRPASSSKLAEVRDRVPSFGGYNSMDMPEWMQENCKLLVLTSSFKGENTTMSFPLNCNVVRAAFGLPLQPERKK